MRQFLDNEGIGWVVEEISHGKTSDYLNRRVHRRTLQFSKIRGAASRRYAPLPSEYSTLDSCSEERLRELLAQARVH